VFPAFDSERPAPHPLAADPHPAGDEVIVSGVPGASLYLSIPRPVYVFAFTVHPTPWIHPAPDPEIERAGKAEGDPFPGRRMRLPMAAGWSGTDNRCIAVVAPHRRSAERVTSTSGCLA
jgi:hypothetical protein